LPCSILSAVNYNLQVTTLSFEFHPSKEHILPFI